MSEPVYREYTCGDCVFVEKCEALAYLTEFSRSSVAYCKMFLRAEELVSVQGETIEVPKWRFEDE